MRAPSQPVSIPDFRKLICALAVVLTAAACGGGSSSPAPVAGTLLLSEVATNFHTNAVAWFEVYNPNATAVGLADYTLKSGWIDPKTAAGSAEPISFKLPALDVPAKGYLVIAAGVHDKLENNAQIVYVKKGGQVPFWQASGSVELLKDGQTADFVRFGASNAAPQTASHWNGPAVPALPSGANEYSKAIVRLASGGMADTNSAADWKLVNFATPAGPNDIAPGVIDSDGDGIPDSAKVVDGTYGGLDLYAMGARPGRRDLFVEIDYMSGADPALTPRQEALQKMVDAFKKQNIALHLDTGPLYSAAFDPARFNLGGGNAVAFAKCIELVTDSTDAAATPGCTSFYSYKNSNFDLRRKLAFHYALFANSRRADGLAGSSGVAKVFGNDLIVTLGGYGFSTAPGAALNWLINVQAATLMHEFGHNLGLQHGGDEDVNNKPNYYSVMNYLYQWTGLSTTPNTIHAAERYYLDRLWKGKSNCNLVENSPCTDQFHMDYSDGSSAELDENQLSEAANIGRGSIGGGYADWNNDDLLTAGLLSIDLNGDAKKTILKDYNDWTNLQLPFARTFYGSTSGRSLVQKALAPRFDPMAERAERLVNEAPLPAALQDELRKLNPALK